MLASSISDTVGSQIYPRELWAEELLYMGMSHQDFRGRQLAIGVKQTTLQWQTLQKCRKSEIAAAHIAFIGTKLFLKCRR